jgi:DNA-binding transcriptional regulator YdaS (Cro superfamily)
MLTLKHRIIFASALLLVLLSTTAAQEISSVPAQSSSLTITAAAAGERVLTCHALRQSSEVCRRHCRQSAGADGQGKGIIKVLVMLR